VLSGAQGGPPEMLAGLVGEQLGVKFVPISFTSDGDRKRVEVPGIMEFEVEALHAHCRSPLGFLLHFGNYSGRLRDVRVGAYHGGYCVGCCWSLMLVLVAVGVMNMAWMAGLTAVVFVEKVWRSGKAFGYAVGGALILAGLLLPWLPPMQTALLG
jgi:Predicted metal-binding integral membrane protein (DUF2182)/Protein of unknown function (DUF1326)